MNDLIYLYKVKSYEDGQSMLNAGFVVANSLSEATAKLATYCGEDNITDISLIPVDADNGIIDFEWLGDSIEEGRTFIKGK